MDILIIAGLLLFALILLLVEVFLIPGISIAGIMAVGCMAYANYYAFTNIGTGAGVVTLLVSIVACAGAIVWFMRSKTLDRVSLKTNITSQVDRSGELSVRVGDTGITTTRLALVGYADMDGTIVEVKSADGFLDEKTPIVVTRITDGIIFVEKKQIPQNS